MYIDNLRWAAAEASKLGVRLTIEAINPVDMPHYMLSNQAQALGLLKIINADNVGLQFDFFHFLRIHVLTCTHINLLTENE